MNIRYFMIIAVLLAGTASCKKFLEIDQPVDRMTTTAVFADSTTAEATVAGVYGKITQGGEPLLNGGMTLLGGVSADELLITATLKTHAEFFENRILPANETNAGLWAKSYAVIYQCNDIIEQLQASKLSIAQRQRLTGEALFLRAFHYFYLLNIYGDVPLAVAADFRINSTLARTNAAQVYTQVEKDLKEARQLLGIYTKDRNRADQWAVVALQARVSLFQQHWADAEAMAGEVINGGAFRLVPLTDVFLKDSKEAILQFPMALSSTSGSPNIGAFVPSNPTLIPSYVLMPNLVDAFEAGDLRKQQWVTNNNVNGKLFYYLSKFKVREVAAGAVKPENNTPLRLAEVYLVRAEAFAHQGKLAAAISDVDKIRQRAGLPLLATTHPGISQEDLLRAIAHERQAELFVEHGHRWLDLKRTGRIDAVLSALKPGWKPTAALFPVPQPEILSAPQLQQNPGY